MSSRELQIAQSERIDEICRRVISMKIADLPARCTQPETPGLIDKEIDRDWSLFETTEDQARIERRLADFVHPHSDILHVGIGNSKLAARFSHRVRSITGITVSPAEVDCAGNIGLPNYTATVTNKYLYRCAPAFGGYDAIVDNNPTSFACCLWHLSAMMASYADALCPSGALFTDRTGLGWVLEVPHALQSCGFNLNQWAALGRCVGLDAFDIDGTVYALHRKPALERLEKLKFHADMPRLLALFMHHG